MHGNIQRKRQRKEVDDGVFIWRGKPDANGKEPVYFDAAPLHKGRREYINTFNSFDEAVVAVAEFKHKHGTAAPNERALNLYWTPPAQQKVYWTALFHKDLPQSLGISVNIRNAGKSDTELANAYRELSQDDLKIVSLWRSNTPIIPARDIYTIIESPTPYTQWLAQRKLKELVSAVDAAFELTRNGFHGIFDPRHPRKDPHWPLLQSRLRVMLPDWQALSTRVNEDGRWQINALCKHCNGPSALYSMRRRVCPYCGNKPPISTTEEGFQPAASGEQLAVWDTPEGAIVSAKRPIAATRVLVPTKLNTVYIWEDLPPMQSIPEYGDFVNHQLVASEVYIPPAKVQIESGEPADKKPQQEQLQAEPSFEARNEATARNLADDMPI